MTEEIIIDGVNVAGCEFYLQDEKYSCDLSFINKEELCKCDDVQDCYYKQFKRLEQENKEEKKAYNECMHYLACMTEQRNKLKTALEEIRNYCDRIEQGSVIGTQDCLINSIKNITNEVLNENK